MADRLRAPFPYFGGKSRAADLVWERFGDPRHVIDPFCGSLALLLARPTPPQLETINDRDPMVANFWRAVQWNPEGVAAAADYPIVETDLHARHQWLVDLLGAGFGEAMMTDPFLYDSLVAGWWAWGLSCWIGGGWCSGTSSWDGRPFAGGEGVRPRKPHLLGNGGAKGLHRQKPDLGGKASPGGRGVHAGVVSRKRPHLCAKPGGKGVHRQRPQLNHGGGRGGGDGRGVHAKRPNLTGHADKGVQRRRPGPQNHGGHQGTSGAHGQALVQWFDALAARLRRVRTCCGDWSRVVTPSVLAAGGERSITAVFLDPPYDPGAGRSAGIYAEDSDGVAAATRDWAVANGDNQRLRIALCGYEGEHTMPASWEVVAWSAGGGYGSQDGTDLNRHRERIWFSPHCLRQPSLFDPG